MKKLIAAAVASLLIGGAAVYMWDDTREKCFQYDTTVESYKICGTPEQIELAQFKRGVAMGNDSYEYFGAVDNCYFRADAQAEMFDWPERYLAAYKSGCRAATGPTYRQQTKRDTNLPNKVGIGTTIDEYLRGGN